jgi:hypothetical protein
MAVYLSGSPRYPYPRGKTISNITQRLDRGRRERAAVPLNDRFADRQSHSHAVGLGRDEWLEKIFSDSGERSRGRNPELPGESCRRC